MEIIRQYITLPDFYPEFLVPLPLEMVFHGIGELPTKTQMVVAVYVPIGDAGMKDGKIQYDYRFNGVRVKE